MPSTINLSVSNARPEELSTRAQLCVYSEYPINTSLNLRCERQPSNDHFHRKARNTPRHATSGVNILYHNPGGIRGKLNGIYATLASDACEYDVIVLTETWLISRYPDSLIAPEGWTVLRRDRYEDGAEGLGGGVLIIARNSLHPTLSLKSANSEQIWARLSLRDHALYVGCFYAPPDSQSDVYQDLLDGFSEATCARSDNDEVLILGDFNLNRLQWLPHDEFENVFLPTNVRSDCEALIADDLVGKGLFQLMAIPNSNGRVLDLVFSSSYDDIQITCPAVQLCSSFVSNRHHQQLSVKYMKSANAENSPAFSHSASTSYDFKRTNYRRLNAKLSGIDWEVTLDHHDVNDSVAAF